jgi:hypothetical protein
MNTIRLERRGARRRRAVREHGIESARVRRVHVAVIDVAAGGVLVETPHRLLPGMPLDIHLERDKRVATVRGRVLRCTVVGLSATLVRYRGAIKFDQFLPWLAADVESGSSFTNAEPQQSGSAG